MPISRHGALGILLAQAAFSFSSHPAVAQHVGPTANGANRTPTAQVVRPAGKIKRIDGSRPVDLALSPDGQIVFVKDNHGLLVLDAQSLELQQRLEFPERGGSMTGIVTSDDGSVVYLTDSGSRLYRAARDSNGAWHWQDTITFPEARIGGAAFPCGLALSLDGRFAYVCLSRDNSLAVIDLEAGTMVDRIDTGVAPYDVVISSDGTLAYVTNLGGSRVADNDDDDHHENGPTAPSAGTRVRVDERGIAAHGSVSRIDLEAARERDEVDVGLSPCAMALTADGSTLYVADSNSDTVSIIDTKSWSRRSQFSTRPMQALPFGSLPSDLALSADENTLLVTNAGNNAVAVFDLTQDSPVMRGLIPTEWFPGAVVRRGDVIYVANIRGVGSRQPRGDGSFNSHRHRGSIQRVTRPQPDELETLTRRCLEDARVPQILRAQERKRTGIEPVPVPARAGEPSVFEHVIYIIKENRTYDQVFGAIGKGNGDPALCVFGREVTPNQHALAEQFVLLDNYYCNGVLSADGHSWATEGATTPYLERSFGGFARSYTFGDDPLTYSSSGFIWDHAIAAGNTFRNFGEFDETRELPDSTFLDVWNDWQRGEHRIRLEHNIGVLNVARYSCPDSPGWNLDIPDQVRADVFLREFEQFERDGDLPNLIIIYLPNDHTSGTAQDCPTPRAMVADNDLAVGRIVQAVSHSPFWPTTCIFINEDDPQDGWDHVDGHRSTCQVISPYTKRGQVVSTFFNQAGVVHTIERILGVPGPANQRYGLAPLMFDCFTTTADLTPFDHLPNNIPLTEMNPARSGMTPQERHWALLSEQQDFTHVDAADEDTLNRVIWHSVRGVNTPYPEEFAGAHARGLGALNLRHAPEELWESLGHDMEFEPDRHETGR